MYIVRESIIHYIKYFIYKGISYSTIWLHRLYLQYNHGKGFVEKSSVYEGLIRPLRIKNKDIFSLDFFFDQVCIVTVVYGNPGQNDILIYFVYCMSLSLSLSP